MGTPTMLITRPTRDGPAVRVMIVMPAGMIMPPPSPCSTRKPISEPADHAMPDSAEPARKSTMEIRYRRLVPKRSAAQPVSGITVASASM
jgi:hypothetical protein